MSQDEKFIYFRYIRSSGKSLGNTKDNVVQIPISLTVGELKEFLKIEEIYNPDTEILQDDSEVIMSDDNAPVTNYFKNVETTNSLYIQKCLMYYQ